MEDGAFRMNFDTMQGSAVQQTMGWTSIGTYYAYIIIIICINKQHAFDEVK